MPWVLNASEMIQMSYTTSEPIHKFWHLFHLQAEKVQRNMGIGKNSPEPITVCTHIEGMQIKAQANITPQTH